MKDMGINSFSCILWGAAPHSLGDLVSWRLCACVVTRFTSAGLLETPRTVARQTPLSMGFFRQESFFFFFWPFCISYGILVPQPEIELTPPAVEVWNFNHWIAREVPQLHLLSLEYKSSYFMQRFQFSGWKESGSRDQEIHAIPRLVRVLEIPQGPVLTVYSKSLQLCPTLGPMDCSSPGSSVCGILQARILEWVAMPSSRVYLL